MTIKYWTGFSKRKNSTKQPSTGTDCVVVLKDVCSIINPIFESATMPADANYIFVSDWNRYYFVTNVTYKTNTIKLFSCEVDVLASYKTQIGSTVSAIEYASNNYDIWKVDERLPVKTTNTFTSASATPGKFLLTGCYLITVVNSTSNTGLISQYIIDAANMQTLTNEILTNATLQTELKEYLESPFDALISCKWLPFDKDEAPAGTDSTIILGVTPTNAQGRKLNNPPVTASSATVSIPWTYNDFRRSAPYSTLSCWIPGYGYTDLNASDLVQDTSLKFDFMLDYGSGDICCNVIDPVSSEIIKSVSYNAAVDVPLARIALDVGGIVQNTTDVLSNATVTASNIGMMNIAGSITGAFSTLASGTNLILSSKRRCISSKGAVGGRAGIWEGIDVEIFVFAIDTEDPDDASYIARNGRPVGLTHAINTHSGYILCSNGSVANVATPLEKDRVNGYINTGFYYE